jgi:hypothetical protein
MDRRKACFIVGLILMATGCHKKTPEGLPFAYVKAISAMADEAVKHCDRLLHEKRCYDVLDDEDPDAEPMEGAPRVPLPANPLGGAPELRRLRASCESADEHDNPRQWCNARSLVRTRIPRECIEFRIFGSWPVVNPQHNEGMSVLVAEGPDCKTPWYWVSAVRKTPGGDWFELDAYFLPKKWLDQHPEANDKIERRLVRPSPDVPAGAEGGEEGQTPDAESDLDKEQVPEHTGGTLTHEAPAVDGEIDSFRMSKAVFSRGANLKACYEAALARNLPRKSLVQIHWKVTTKGRATNVEIEEENVGDPKLLLCLRHEIAQTSFPAEKGGPTDVVFHFIYDVGHDPRRKTSNGP